MDNSVILPIVMGTGLLILVAVIIYLIIKF